MKQVWSKDEEYFACESLSELIRDHDLSVGKVVYFGNASHPSPSTFIDADNIIEQAQERAYDEYGDHAEFFLDGVTEEEKKILNDFLWEWLDRNSDVTFYMVSDVSPYTVTELDIEKSK